MICVYMACNNDVYAEQENTENQGFVWTHTGFTEKIVFPNAMWMYHPKLKIVDDKLYVSHNTGIFSKNLNEEDSARELFDRDNPEIIYATGGEGGSLNKEDFHLYRSTDTGDSWQHVFEHNTNVSGGGEVIDMVQYKNKLFLYTTVSGVAGLDLGTTTGNVSIKTGGLTVYPNPIQNRLYFDTDLAVDNIEIISQTGQVLQNTNVLNNERQIAISRLPAGVYLAVFHAKELSVTKKIIVK